MDRARAGGRRIVLLSSLLATLVLVLGCEQFEPIIKGVIDEAADEIRDGKKGGSADSGSGSSGSGQTAPVSDPSGGRFTDNETLVVIGAPSSEAVDISGLWWSYGAVEGLVFTITQTGNTFQWQNQNPPDRPMPGNGTITGNKLEVTWVDLGVTYPATGEITVGPGNRGNHIALSNGVNLSRAGGP